MRAGIPRFLLSSTAAYQSSEDPLTEDSPLGPTNTYGYTKLAKELDPLTAWNSKIAD